jgi:ribulose-5-phosphate 4-epimerase/fuculose-1-phosphate aldolase
MFMASDPVSEIRDQVALANRLLHHYGLSTYSGHVSGRVPGTDTFVIKARPEVSLDRVQPSDLMVMDVDGHVMEASNQYPEPVDGWPLHAELYRARPEIASVVYTQQKWCTVFGVAGRDVLPVQHPATSAVAAQPWPVYQAGQAGVTTAAQAQEVAGLLGDNVACHLRNHGMVFVGSSVERALLASVNGEYLAEMTWHAMLLGDPATIPFEYMRVEVEQRSLPSREPVRDGVARGEWDNHVWADQHRESARIRDTRF